MCECGLRMICVMFLWRAADKGKRKEESCFGLSQLPPKIQSQIQVAPRYRGPTSSLSSYKATRPRRISTMYRKIICKIYCKKLVRTVRYREFYFRIYTNLIFLIKIISLQNWRLAHLQFCWRSVEFFRSKTRRIYEADPVNSYL